MTKAVQQLLESFEILTEQEKHEAAAEFLRRSLRVAPAQVPDDTLIATADELFRELDARDSADAKPDNP
jgi:hypothetical protein